MEARGRRFDPRRLDAWVTLWNTYDLDQVDQLFLTDRRVTYFSSEKQGLVRGIDAVRAHHAGFGFVPGGKASQNRLWLEAVEIEAHGPAVLVTAIWHFQRAGAATAQRGPVTLLWVEDGATHRIAHANFGNYASDR